MWGFFMFDDVIEVADLPALNDRFNRVRRLSLMLKDAVEDLTHEERELLFKYDFKKWERKTLHYRLYCIVGVLNKIATGAAPTDDVPTKAEGR